MSVSDGIPKALFAEVAPALRMLGDQSAIRSVRRLSGGCINNATQLQTGQGIYLLKWNPDPLPGMFSAEAKGLRLLGETGPVRVPAVLMVREASAGCPAFILLEWLEGTHQNSAASQAGLGERLAELHRRGTSPRQPPAYGLDEDNYLGSSIQLNTWVLDWARFFADHRLRPQMETARRQNRLHPQRARHLERLIDRLPDLLGGVERRPALIHGDLWGGNVIPAQDGLALIDPAVYYADREAEIAYTELFGGFSGRFYDAYQSVWPLDPGYPERRDLYNLYHLLNHLNLFGDSYGGQVDMVLGMYT